MRKVALVLLFSLIFLIGCESIPAPLGVVLGTPSNGSTVDPQYAVLTWISVGKNTYEVQVSQDAGFQNLAINATNVTNLLYPVSPGTLKNGSTYFWRVRALRGGEASQWTSASYFLTSGITPPVPPPVTSGTIITAATLNGSPWNGPISYGISGPSASTGNSVPYSFGNASVGTYIVTYYSGGPAGATLSGITPSAQQALGSGGTLYFTLNFMHQQAYGNIVVHATLDGAPWQTAPGSGPVSYSIQGPRANSGSTIPNSYTNHPAGNYVITYESGGPIGASFAGVSPSTEQTLMANGTIIFTLNFRTQSRGTVHVNATLNGEPWSGAIGYVLTGPFPESGGQVPYSHSNAPSGNYSVSYSAGGPPSSIFEGVSHSSQYLPAGGSITFTLKFVFRGVTPGPLVQ